jgi:hypothetical protein
MSPILSVISIVIIGKVIIICIVLVSNQPQIKEGQNLSLEIILILEEVGPDAIPVRPPAIGIANE